MAAARAALRARALLLTALAALLASAGGAFAHAIMERTEPAAGAVLDAPPARVQVWFSEPVEAEFVPVTVRDAQGRRADAGNAGVVAGNPRAVAADLSPDLPAGFYSVTYRVVSMDGHPVEGAFGFSVGAAAQAPAPAAAPAGTGGGAVAVAAVVTGAGFLGTLGLAGLAAFLALVWRPAPAPPAARSRALVTWLLALVLAATLAHLLVFTYRAAGELTAGNLLRAATNTAVGRIALARAAVAVALAFRLRAAALPGPGALVPAAALLLTHSLSSHAAALQARDALAVPMDWVHLAAAAPWVGGLLGFAWLAWGLEPPVLAALIRRFSAVAMAGLAVVAATGAYAALARYPSWGAVPDTHSGRALLAKLALLVPLLAMGLANQRLFGPRLAAQPQAGARFRRTVAAEVVLVAGLLLAAGTLSSLPPARAELAQRSGPFAATQAAGDLAVQLRVQPARAGYNTALVSVAGPGGAPVAGARVELRVVMPAHDMGTQAPVGKPAGAGTYAFDEVVLGMHGEWSIEVVVLRERYPEARAAFIVPVPEPVQ